MICKTRDEKSGTDIYLPIGLDQKLWKSIMQRKFKTGFGEFKITKKMIDWKNTDLIRERDYFLNSYNLSQKWNDDPIYSDIIYRKKTKNDQLNIDDLRNSVECQDIKRIKILLAIGTKADEKFEDYNGTNILLC